MVMKRNGSIPQLQARQAYSTVMMQAQTQPERDYGKMVLDLTPNYMFESDRLPARIACIVPWVKIFCLLRNPIERARSQYDMKLRFVKQRSENDNTNQFGNPLPTFDEYVRHDIAALFETGVLQDWSVVDFDAFFESPAAVEAWRTYLNSGLNAPVGMGLYAMQLKPFLGLPNPFFAIRSEDLSQDTDATYQQVLAFLGLLPYHLKVYPLVNNARRQQTTKLSNTTEQLLQEVFAPFNRKLGDLLGTKWEKVWT
jgi:hypothetical protein